MFQSLSQPEVLAEAPKPLSNLSNAVLGEQGPSPSPSQTPAPPTSGAQGEASGGAKKSSFDRIVDKLGPAYPDYSRCVCLIEVGIK